jgi:hypothetical protein
MSDAGRWSRTVQARCPNFEDQRDGNRCNRCDRLPQLTSVDGGNQLPLRMKLAKRASVRIVLAVETINDSRDRRARFGDGAGAGAGSGEMPVFVLAPHQLVQALTEQHHPRVEDGHAAGEKGLVGSHQGAEILRITLDVTCNQDAIMWLANSEVNHLFGTRNDFQEGDAWSPGNEIQSGERADSFNCDRGDASAR